MVVGEARQLQTLRRQEVSGGHYPQNTGARKRMAQAPHLGVGALSRAGGQASPA